MTGQCFQYPLFTLPRRLAADVAPTDLRPVRGAARQGGREPCSDGRRRREQCRVDTLRPVLHGEHVPGHHGILPADVRRVGRAAGGLPDLLSQVEAETDLVEGTVAVGATRPLHRAARIQEGHRVHEYTGEWRWISVAGSMLQPFCHLY